MMMKCLDEVIAAETLLSDVDGEAGQLVIRGASLDELAGKATPEEVVARIWDGFFDSPVSPEELRQTLGTMRAELFAHLELVDDVIMRLPPADGLRALIARLPDGHDRMTAIRLAAAPAVFLPSLLRLHGGCKPLAPDPGLPQSADILRMTAGEMPSPEQVAAFDTYLVTISDHGLNASTFAARVIASTGAGLTSSVLGAISALKGPLHGGAPGPVLDMLDAIGHVENAETWLREAIYRGERLMGFGHRIYKVRDPRADALKAALQLLTGMSKVDPERMQLAEAVERAAIAILKESKPDRRLDVNVEFYTALLLDALGFPRESFTGVFAIGRTIGWIGHALEQALNGRLIRPRSIYIGPKPGAGMSFAGHI